MRYVEALCDEVVTGCGDIWRWELQLVTVWMLCYDTVYYRCWDRYAVAVTWQTARSRVVNHTSQVHIIASQHVHVLSITHHKFTSHPSAFTCSDSQHILVRKDPSQNPMCFTLPFFLPFSPPRSLPLPLSFLSQWRGPLNTARGL